ncbi:unnamed protein product [Scytosiphon promiscuus]
MRTIAFACAVAACAGGADAFVGSMRPASSSVRRAGASGVRMAADATVPDLLRQTEQLKLLSTASKLGLLSKLEKAGLTLKDVEKLLPLVDENDLIGLAKGLGPDLIKALYTAGLASFAAGTCLPLSRVVVGCGLCLMRARQFEVLRRVGLVALLPDDTVPGVALETFVAFPLLFVVPAACGVAGFALSSLKNGSLVNFVTSYKPAPASSAASSSPAPVKAVKAAKKAVVKKSSGGGRPTAASSSPAPKGKAKAKAAPKPAPKKAAPKPAPKPKAQGNISNLPKAL